MGALGLSGIASGIDTSSIVNQLMAIERNKIARQQLRTKAIEAEAGGLRDIQTKLKALKSAAEGLRTAGLWADTQTVESSNPARLTVERTGMAPAGGHSLWVRQVATAEQEGFTYTPSSTASTLTIAGKPVDIPANATTADVAALVNRTADLAAYATAVDGDTIVFSGRQTGTAGAFTVEGAQLAVDGSFTMPPKDADYSLDGGNTWKQSSSNVLSDVIVGLKITLKGTTVSAESINVGVASVDATAVKDKLKAFVGAYNDVITATRAKLDEKSVRDPQTTTEATKGQLFGDSGLSGMLSRMRTMISDSVAGVSDTAMDQLAEIGISTGKASSGATSNDAKIGKLVIDDAKLDAALANPTAVRALFGASGTDGFAQKIEKLLDSEAGTTSPARETGRPRNMANPPDRTPRAEDEADRLEERADALGEQIDETRRDWEDKKHDPDVPGAAGDPDRAEGGLPPTMDKITPGD